MNFASDNIAPVHPQIMEAIQAANHDSAASYGADAWTQKAQKRVEDVFETRCAFYLVATGGAANGLALSALTAPWAAVFCHEHAHIAADEGNGPEFFGAGLRLLPLAGAHGKISACKLRDAIAHYPRDIVHSPQPRALSLSQATECGTAYSQDELRAIHECARDADLTLHMDGARLANVVARGEASPADLTWRAGIDILSLGGTKNGAMMLEALIVFDPEGRNQSAAHALPFLRKRAGQLMSKHRFLSAQLNAFLHDDLWLRLALRANQMATRLASGFAELGLMIVHEVDANEVFVRLPASLVTALREKGASFYPWSSDGADCFRFVTSWATSSDEVDTCLSVLSQTRHPHPDGRALAEGT